MKHDAETIKGTTGVQGTLWRAESWNAEPIQEFKQESIISQYVA